MTISWRWTVLKSYFERRRTAANRWPSLVTENDISFRTGKCPPIVCRTTRLTPRECTTAGNFSAQCSRAAALDPLPALTTATVRRAHWRRFRGFRAGLTNFDTLGWAELLTDSDYCYVPARLTVTRIHGNQVTSRAQQDVQTAVERQEFWKAFCRDYRERLGLSRSASLVSRLWGPSGAATQVAIKCVKHEYVSAVRMMGKVPMSWWPLVPPLAPARMDYRVKARSATTFTRTQGCALLVTDCSP